MSSLIKLVQSFIWGALFFLTACSPGRVASIDSLTELEPVDAALKTAVSPTPTTLPTITLPISVYLVDDESGDYPSSRDEAQLRQVYEDVNVIWSQANIVLDVQTIERITLPDAIVERIRVGDFQPFFSGVDTNFGIPNLSLINAFYAESIGGPNGIVPFNSHVFFVTDFPSVHHERVSSHEIGHILGLHHVLDDRDRLLFSGTNGVTLSAEEVTVARYGAQGLLDRVR